MVGIRLPNNGRKYYESKNINRYGNRCGSSVTALTR